MGRQLTDQELQLEVVLRHHLAVEGHLDDELLAAAHHQVAGVVGGGVVVGLVDLLTHVHALHRQSAARRSHCSESDPVLEQFELREVLGIHQEVGGRNLKALKKTLRK